MSTVRGHACIYTRCTARKRYRCDHEMHTTWASPEWIEPGDVYFRAALPPGSEFGYERWMTMRLCWGCAPVELTSTAMVARIARGEVGA